jgi:putative selenate reductase FAD-binding subunit
MITQYFRPQKLEEALELLKKPNTLPLGGGTLLTQQNDISFSVVDLQALGLDTINVSAGKMEIGATTTLQALLENPSIPEALKKCLELETPLNLRNMGTVAGTLVTCDGRSPFGLSMLALDAKLTFMPGKTEIALGDYLATRASHHGIPPGNLIIKIEIPLKIQLAFETVARTPVDKPIVCAALAQWPSGRTRLAIGGWGQIPTLVLDGKEASGLVEAARSACTEAEDAWASAAYRMEIAGILAKRCQDAMDRSRG